LDKIQQMKRIGERIKRKREQLNLQLNDLARRVGVSSSALSQIENSKAFPSIITLKSIAENLHTTVGDLIGENETSGKNPVIRKEEMRFVDSNVSGTTLYLLSNHDVNKIMDTYYLKFVKDSDSLGFFTEYNGQVFSHLISGALTYILEGKNHELKAGDSIYFNAKALDKVVNNLKKKAEVLWIISPPNF
jgi:transcriptional regulator with XRE-family HTH domain